MGFSNSIKIGIKPQYTTGIVERFYQPLLREATLYQRVSGFFNSAGLDLYIDGLEELAGNNGQIQFIVSKEVSEADYRRIQSGYTLLSELKSMKLAERNEVLTTDAQKKLGNLAFLIAAGRARVKVALTKTGLFHDKFGLIYSGDECVFFNGSANETRSGISENYESISVDFSWDDSVNVTNRIEANQKRFMRLWNDDEPGVKVIEASDMAYEEIAKYKVQSEIKEIAPIVDDTSEYAVEGTISFLLINHTVLRVDKTEVQLCSTDRKLRVGSDISLFFEPDNSTVLSESTYKDIERIIRVTKERADRRGLEVFVSAAVEEFINRNKYSIEEYKILGQLYKGKIQEFPQVKKALFNTFETVVQNEVTRPLQPLHIRAAYYEYEMARAANFSVPGAGKTAMILGVFAYLNSKEASVNERVDRMLVICPINAFDSWEREFKLVFGNKKALRLIDCQKSKDFIEQLRTDWAVSNLILINYEALQGYVDELKRVLDSRTMLIFDEVHRIKNPTGIRAQAALSISNLPQFRFVMTGTPIPNSYQDVYNFLHILYSDEYNAFFGWDPMELVKPSIRKINEINQSIYPFFWRTNKNDLAVPPADPDLTFVVAPNNAQSELAEAIYSNETSSLAVLIRLIQASTNPSLLNAAINYEELMVYDEEGDTKSISKEEFKGLLGEEVDSARYDVSAYKGFNLDQVESPKFLRGIELVRQLVLEGKKVIVWGVFVDTMHKIVDNLRDLGIRVNLVYGGTDKRNRVNLIDEFRDGAVQVLVSNPQTLGESISLHQTVHDAVYFEYNFNLTFMLQSRDRIHRLGLREGQYTRYYYLQTKDEDLFSDRPGFIDQKIYKRLKEKEKIMYDAIDNERLSIEYSDSEILDAIKIIDEERQRIEKQGE